MLNICNLTEHTKCIKMSLMDTLFLFHMHNLIFSKQQHFNFKFIGRHLFYVC